MWHQHTNDINSSFCCRDTWLPFGFCLESCWCPRLGNAVTFMRVHVKSCKVIGLFLTYFSWRSYGRVSNVMFELEVFSRDWPKGALSLLLHREACDIFANGCMMPLPCRSFQVSPASWLSHHGHSSRSDLRCTNLSDARASTKSPRSGSKCFFKTPLFLSVTSEGPRSPGRFAVQVELQGLVLPQRRLRSLCS